MTVDLAESLLANKGIDQDDLARRFAASYRWSRGYGPGAAKLLKRIRRGGDWRTVNREIYRNGSYGNGAAMRAPLLGLVYKEHAALLRAAH
jgi:poly(ADP-ribose) glycohydrolase ARH3